MVVMGLAEQIIRKNLQPYATVSRLLMNSLLTADACVYRRTAMARATPRLKTHRVRIASSIQNRNPCGCPDAECAAA